jgi:hypothetical protein
VHAEPRAPAAAARGLAQALLSLAQFVGVARVDFATAPPSVWASALG